MIECGTCRCTGPGSGPCRGHRWHRCARTLRCPCSRMPAHGA